MGVCWGLDSKCHLSSYCRRIYAVMEYEFSPVTLISLYTPIKQVIELHRLYIVLEDSYCKEYSTCSSFALVTAHFKAESSHTRQLSPRSVLLRWDIRTLRYRAICRSARREMPSPLRPVLTENNPDTVSCLVPGRDYQPSCNFLLKEGSVFFVLGEDKGHDRSWCRLAGTFDGLVLGAWSLLGVYVLAFRGAGPKYGLKTSGEVEVADESLGSDMA